MAIGDVRITRAVGARDDYLDNNVTAVDSGSVTVDTVSSDGDNLTWNVTFTNPVFGNASERYRAITNGPNSTTFPRIIARWQNVTWPSSLFQLSYFVHYSDNSVETGGISSTATTSYAIFDTTLITANKTVDQIGFTINVTGSPAAGTYSFQVLLDFVFIYKERLTLPAASQPLSLPLQRRIAALQVPNRQGDILQDLGSSSPMVEVDGTLITTTSATNYTGDQWWDVMVGTWLEGNWQWFDSDRVAYKYQITDLVPQQDPGKVGYYNYRMKLRKVDIISATAQTFSSNNNPAGAIQ